MKLAAERLGRSADWQLPPLAVTFGNPGEPPVPGEPIREEHRNLHGRTRTTCRLCGECDIGCNFGSKNTLDYTYLSAAKRAGAELRTLAEVKSFCPRSRLR
jgi:cholesterol oxidase